MAVPVHVQSIMGLNGLALSQILFLCLLFQLFVLVNGVAQVLEHAPLCASDQIVVSLNIVIFGHLFKLIDAELLKLKVALVYTFEL